jgi:hypothetical protein
MAKRILRLLLVAALCATLVALATALRAARRDRGVAETPMATALPQTETSAMLKRAILVTLKKAASCSPAVDPATQCGPRATHLARTRSITGPLADRCAGVSVDPARLQDQVHEWIGNNWQSLPVEPALASSSLMILGCSPVPSDETPSLVEAVVLLPRPLRTRAAPTPPDCLLPTPTASSLDCRPGSLHGRSESVIRVPVDLSTIAR